MGVGHLVGGSSGEGICRAALAKPCSTDATYPRGGGSDRQRTRPLQRASPSASQCASNPGDRVRQRWRASSGIGGAVEQGFARGCEQSQVLNAWPRDHRLPHGCSVFEVLSLRPFFAPANKGCRLPGRDPAGGGGPPTGPLGADCRHSPRADRHPNGLNRPRRAAGE